MTTRHGRAIAIARREDDGHETTRRRRTAALAALGAALLGFVLVTTRADAQGPDGDARWRPFLGCWTPVEARGVAADSVPMTCVVPDGRAGVRVLAVVNGTVREEEAIRADGERHPVAEDDCTGWSRADWSADGRRLHLSGDLACGGAAPRRASGLWAFSGAETWLDLRAVRAGSGGGLRATRLVPATAAVTLADGRTIAAPTRGTADARLALGGAIDAGDVIDASRRVDPVVLEAWLLERREGLGLDAKALVALADAKVPTRTIDLLVALDNPTRFNVSMRAPGRADVTTVPQPRPAEYAGGMPRSLFPGWGVYDPFLWNSAFGWSNWGFMSPFASPWYGYDSFYAGRYGGWVGPIGPIVVVPAPPASGGIPGQPGSGSPGRRPVMVNGDGATRGGADRPVMRPSGPRGGSPAGGGGTAGGGSTGGGGGRTARPRP